jgi:hypothetical protein
MWKYTKRIVSKEYFVAKASDKVATGRLKRRTKNAQKTPPTTVTAHD